MERSIALDVSKLCLAFMVVALHAGFLEDVNALASHLTVNGVFRIAVPIFLIINGFYFYIAVSQRKVFTWFKKTFFLYCFWMFVYSYFWLPVDEVSYQQFLSIIVRFFLGYFHLWYVAGMLGAAGIVVCLKGDKLNYKILIMIVISTFFCGVIVQYYGNFFVFNEFRGEEYFKFYWFHRNVVFLSLPFFLVGFIVGRFKVYDHFSMRFLFFLSLLGGGGLISESYMNYKMQSSSLGYDNYFSLLVVCPAIFLLTLKLEFKGNSKILAQYSAGIFFVHALVLNLLRVVTPFDETMLTLVVVVVSCIVSSLLVVMSKRFKFLI